jgi:hypothetical protein
MNSKLLFVAVAAVTMSAPPAFAAGNSHSGATVGDCLSDGFYGNEPNMADGSVGGPAEQQPGTKGGNVLPSQSPGPKVNNPADPDNPFPGNSVGDYQQLGFSIPEICRAITG